MNDAWLALQRTVDALLAPWCRRSSNHRDVVDVSDALLDLTICPRCGTDLAAHTNAKVS